MNKDISALVAGKLDAKSPKDYLFIGTPNSIQCYDIELNKDVFFHEIVDGASSVVVATVSGISVPVVLVGGNGAIHGLDATGKTVFWTVTGAGAHIITNFSSITMSFSSTTLVIRHIHVLVQLGALLFVFPFDELHRKHFLHVCVATIP